MKASWTPTGDIWPQPAMVMVLRNYGSTVGLAGPGGLNDYSAPKACLHPMPPTITPEQQAVLDAAVRQARAGSASGEGARARFSDAYLDTHEAVRAMHASQQPVDPVKELLEAAKAVAACDFYCSTAARERLRIAIAALEKKP